MMTPMERLQAEAMLKLFRSHSNRQTFKKFCEVYLKVCDDIRLYEFLKARAMEDETYKGDYLIFCKTGVKVWRRANRYARSFGCQVINARNGNFLISFEEAVPTLWDCRNRKFLEFNGAHKIYFEPYRIREEIKKTKNKTNRLSLLTKTALVNIQKNWEYVRGITVNFLMRIFLILCACRMYPVQFSEERPKPIPVIPNFPSKVPPPIPEFQMEDYLFECKFQGNPVRVGLDFRFFPYPTDLRILGCGWGTFLEIPFSGIRCEMVVEEKRPGKWKSLNHEWGAAFIAFLSDSLRAYFKSNQNPCPLTLFAAFLNFEDLKKDLPFIIVRSFRQVHPRRQHEENKDSISTDRFNGAVVIRKDSNPLILSPTINVRIDSKWVGRFGLEAFLSEMKEEPFGLVEGDFLPSVLYWLPGDEQWQEIDDLKIQDRGAFGIGEVSQAPSEWFDLQGNVFAYKGWASREIKDAGIFLGTINPLEQMKEIADTFFIWYYPEDGEYPPYCDVLSFERSVESLFEKLESGSKALSANFQLTT